MEFVIDGHIVTVDAQDAHLFDGKTWRVVTGKHNKKSYVKWSTHKNGKCAHFVLHRLILNAAPGVLVDHHDGNGLNCSRANLRVGDHVLNARNTKKRTGEHYTSRFKGVNWQKNKSRWVAKIRYGGRQHHLGLLKSEVHAAFVYDQASLQFHGNEGRRNFLPLVI